jgi:hypothetical protein
VCVVVEGVWVVQEREVGGEAVFGVSLWSRALERRLRGVGQSAKEAGRCKEDGERKRGGSCCKLGVAEKLEGRPANETSNKRQAPTICLCDCWQLAVGKCE